MTSNELIAELDKISVSDIEELTQAAKEKEQAQKKHDTWVMLKPDA